MAVGDRNAGWLQEKKERRLPVSDGRTRYVNK